METKMDARKGTRLEIELGHQRRTLDWAGGLTIPGMVRIELPGDVPLPEVVAALRLAVEVVGAELEGHYED